MKDISIYVHIPFCRRKCSYCAFNSFVGDTAKIDEYIDLLCKEISSRAVKRPVRTIYFGGGTPSVLSCEQFSRIVNTIFDNFDVFEDAEFTVEGNPDSLNEEILSAWKKLRVNRVSIGVQSLDDKILKKIGRLHNKSQALSAVKLARKMFDNVSCDLIVGLENESGKDLCEHAKQLLALGVKHISCYLLEVYENTPLKNMIDQNLYKPQSDEQTIFAFNKLANYLVDAGFERYEISNFAKPGYESQHNMRYWNRDDYLGFGLGAHSFVGNVRTENGKTFEDYAIGKNSCEHLTPKMEDEEKIMLGLRCKLGVDLKSLSVIDLEKNAYFQDYLKQGILKRENERVWLNEMFYGVSNTIISNLFE